MGIGVYGLGSGFKAWGLGCRAYLSSYKTLGGTPLANCVFATYLL